MAILFFVHFIDNFGIVIQDGFSSQFQCLGEFSRFHGKGTRQERDAFDFFVRGKLRLQQFDSSKNVIANCFVLN